MTTNNPDPLEVLKDAVRRQIRAYHVTRQTYDGPGKTRGRRMHSGDAPAATAILAIIAKHYAPVIAENERLRAENYKTFTDGMEAAAQICGSLAETTYDDTDAFEAATGCEAEIMKVVKQQRKEQALGAKP